MIERVLVMRHGGMQSAASLLLPEPKAGKPQAYVLAGDQLQEVQRFKALYSSWMIGGELPSDGGLYLSTPVDPLFVVLPLLDKSRKRSADGNEDGYFCALDQILEDGSDAFPHLQLLADLVRPLLLCICDVKEAGHLTFYRLNDDRVLAWLLIKLQQAQTALQGALGGLDEEARQVYVIGFLGEYVAERWTSMLAKHLEVDLSAMSGSAAIGHVRPLGQSESSLLEAEKRPRLDPKEVARLNARKKAEETKAANVAKLAQGTKSITNFFKPRTK